MRSVISFKFQKSSKGPGLKAPYSPRNLQFTTLMARKTPLKCNVATLSAGERDSRAEV